MSFPPPRTPADVSAGVSSRYCRLRVLLTPMLWLSVQSSGMFAEETSAMIELGLATTKWRLAFRRDRFVKLAIQNRASVD